MSGLAETDITTDTEMQGGAWAVFWRVIAVFMVVAGGALAYGVFQNILDQAVSLVLLGIYAATGIFFLLCAAFGVCHLTAGDPRRMPAEAMLDLLPQAVVLTSEGGALRYMNAGYRRLAGHRAVMPEILLARDEQAAKVIYRLSLAVREGREETGEIRLASSLLAHEREEQEAGPFIYSVTARPFKLDGYSVVMWSVTDRTQHNRKQEIFVGNLQDAVNHLDYAPAGFISWDREGRVGYLNATLAGWLGIDLAAFTPGSMVFEALAGAENMRHIRQQMEKSPALPVVVIDLDIKDSGQKLRHLRFYATREAGGAFARAVVLPADIAESRSILNEIISADQGTLHFEDYFDVSPIALAVIDRDGSMQRANSCFLRLFKLDYGIDIDQGTKGFLSALEPKSGEQVERAVQQILTGEKGHASPIDAMLLPGEKERYIRLYINSVGREVIGNEAVVISVVETTEQRALEQQMEHSQKMQAVGQLAGGIAHDFNNVLTAIIMSCDLLLGNHRSSDPSHQDIMNIKNNANRAASLVRQLLAFSRRQTLRPEVLDLTDMLADLRMLLIRLVGSTVQIKVEHGRSLWPVKADQAELERVIMNLAANARDAMPEGGTLTIRTANIIEVESRNLNYQGFVPGDYVLIEVSDTGNGIAPDIRAKIFDPFFTTKEVGKGTGLGLSMVYGIVTQTGGYIHCDSEMGRGTRFSIYLPRHLEDMKQISVKPAGYDESVVQKAGDSQPVDLSGSATVLLVEDEDAVRMGGVKALQSRGYTVLEASSGLEALEVFEEKKGQIDIVVSDVVMPEMDGPTLLKELRKLYPEIKFIFVSGYAQDAFARNLPSDAAFAFLAKPFSLKQLATAVKEMLSESHA